MRQGVERLYWASVKNSMTKLEYNLRLYAWMKTFTKRVYFPVTSVLLVADAHLSVQQIAIIGASAAIVQAVVQLPSGYVADKFGNRKTMLFGALLSLPAPLFYIFFPSFWGGIIGLDLYALGLAFISGASEALIYDTLSALGRVKDYAKEVGRAQSIALGGNFVLIALVPLTYALDHRLPFVIGLVCAGLLVASVAKMVEPVRHTPAVRLTALDALRNVMTLRNVVLFLFAGFTGGIVERVFDFMTLSLVGVGVPPALTGFVVAVSSVMGAVMGWYVFIFDRLKPKVFYFADLVLVCLLLGLQGVPIAVVVVPSFIIFLGYVRVRFIVFQSKLFADVDHAYKATLISALSFFGVIGSLFTMVVFGQMSTVFGFMPGLRYFAVTIFFVGLLLLLLVMLTRRARAIQNT